MSLRSYQFAELSGILLVLASAGTQMFYLEPLQRQIEWNKVAFIQQQNGQISHQPYSTTVSHY